MLVYHRRSRKNLYLSEESKVMYEKYNAFYIYSIYSTGSKVNRLI